MTALAILLAGAGLLLLFAGVRGEDPRVIIVETIRGRK